MSDINKEQLIKEGYVIERGGEITCNECKHTADEHECFYKGSMCLWVCENCGNPTVIDGNALMRGFSQ